MKVDRREFMIAGLAGVVGSLLSNGRSTTLGQRGRHTYHAIIEVDFECGDGFDCVNVAKRPMLIRAPNEAMARKRAVRLHELRPSKYNSKTGTGSDEVMKVYLKRVQDYR